jgi:thymidylate synthase
MKLSPYDKKMTKDVYFISYKQFIDFYKRTNANVFVIGGGEVYNIFLNNEDLRLRPSKVYLTEVYEYMKGKDKDTDKEPNVFMDHLDQSYRLVGFSERKRDSENNLDFRFLEYRFFPGFFTEEYKYLDLAQRVLTSGSERSDRTGVGTISIFGGNMSFDISDTVPLLTTKRVPWKHCIHELLWFMRGDTDNDILKKQGVKIWDGNTSREFLDKRGLHHYKEGILGPLYGWQWRFFGARYSQAFADTSMIDRSMIGGFDQLESVINLLKTDPFSRRIVMSYWNPPDFDKMVLLPCHYSIQFYVREHYNIKYLDCLFNMRSNDMFLGNPFNIFSYTVLVYILALKCDMKPGKLIYNGGDVHIYKNHIEQIEEQLSRNPRPLPKLKLNNKIKYKKIEDITIEDFDLIGYFPHPVIKAPMAV